MDRVTSGGPWSFDNHLLILGRVGVGAVLANISLFHVPFWVQVHNLLMGFMTTLVGKPLGNYIGEFMEYDALNNTNLWWKYMRIRVLFDVRTPLKCTKKIKLQGEEWNVVSFKYERFGNFCFLCGLLSHTERYCLTRFNMATDSGEW